LVITEKITAQMFQQVLQLLVIFFTLCWLELYNLLACLKKPKAMNKKPTHVGCPELGNISFTVGKSHSIHASQACWGGLAYNIVLYCI